MSTPATVTTHSDREPFGAVEWGFFAAVSLLWGSSYLLIMLGLDAFHPGFITWGRVALGAAALMALPSARRRIDPPDRARMVLLSLTWVAVPFTLFPLAEEHINSAVTGLLTGAVPFFAGLFGALWFGRVPRGPQRLGIAVGFAGIALVSLGTSNEGGTAVVGVVMVLAASMGYGYSTNLAGSLQHKYGPVPVMAWMLTLATVWTTPFGVLGLTRSEFAWGSTAAVAVLGVFCTGIAFVFMASLVGRVGGPRASFVAYAIPVVALALGAVFLSERITALALLGVVVVLGGAALAAQRER